MQLGGALLSLALVVGIGVWGYKLMLRDATGVPVVRAMSGPMREAPASPGGEVAPHMGLSVNEVAALGTAGPESDALVLAPQPLPLADEDLAHVMTAEADELRADEDAGDLSLVSEALAAEGVERPGAAEAAAEAEALAEAILASAEVTGATTAAAPAPRDPADEEITQPLEELSEEAAVADVVAEAVPDALPEGGEPAGAQLIAASVPGVSSAPRPPARPASAVPASARAAAAPVEALTVAEEPLPAGTVLVQLGAFASADLASDAWAAIQADFGELIGERQPLVQTATAGGSTFYRLRMQGFEALGDARRFCSALAAENAGCIPYLVEG
ncbi:SPOR domain-containing protein [Pseudoroseicyclus sp. CXY001]|uniref:SPOR domain-containing protein n=1 Tax=Pseudoroseicyclus sp. CXY001 TaxID=3242492 RepID=UPI00358DAFA0